MIGVLIRAVFYYGGPVMVIYGMAKWRQDR